MPLERLVRQAVELARAPRRLDELRDDYARLEARLAALEYAATPRARRPAGAGSPLDLFHAATR